jgi:hypothetical protein
MKLNSFTCLAFLVNEVIDAGPDSDLSYQEIFDAARDGRLIYLLTKRYDDLTNWTWVTQGCADHLEQMEAALRDAASGYDGRMGRPTGPVSGLCLVMTIVLEAIQQQFHPSPACEPAPEDA